MASACTIGSPMSNSMELATMNDCREESNVGPLEVAPSSGPTAEISEKIFDGICKNGAKSSAKA